MRDTPLSILAIFAHPDDEVGDGSTIAYYTNSGVLANLVCATRGEAATIYCEGCATRENLAEVRTRELECACRHLGFAELRWLDWPDGGIAALPRTDAVRRVVAILRELQPDVVFTHPENGGYPHPDHLAIWEIVREAFDAAADPAQYPGIGGAPWPVARLFTRAIPQTVFDAAPAFAEARVELKGAQLPFFATPDEAIDVQMEVSCCADQRQAAWECHVSQHNPEGAFSRMPEAVRQSMSQNGYFLLVAERVPLPPEGKRDLLAGLEAWTGQPTAALDYADSLRATLAVRRAYAEVYADYARTTREPHFAEFLRRLPEQEQEFVYLLAQALRRAGRAPGKIEPDARVMAQGRGCRSTRAQMQFLVTVARHAVTRYDELAELAPDDEQRQVWQELLPLAQAHLEAVTALAKTV